MDWAGPESSETLNDQAVAEARDCAETCADGLSRIERLIVDLLIRRRGALVTVHEILLLCSGIFDGARDADTLGEVLEGLASKLRPTATLISTKTSKGLAYRID